MIFLLFLLSRAKVKSTPSPRPKTECDNINFDSIRFFFALKAALFKTLRGFKLADGVWKGFQVIEHSFPQPLQHPPETMAMAMLIRNSIIGDNTHP